MGSEMHTWLMIAEDVDVDRVADELHEQFDEAAARGFVANTVWAACHDLDGEVPRAALAEFTHHLARQRIVASIERRKAG
jgi:hypothetical protein